MEQTETINGCVSFELLYVTVFVPSDQLTQNEINCSITFGDSSHHPINAIMNWTSNDNYYTSESPQRARVDPYVLVSTSTITVDASDPSTFRCTVPLHSRNRRIFSSLTLQQMHLRFPHFALQHCKYRSVHSLK